ncbi:MAG: mechanosensitive ion channel [Chloroflexota bacterium]|nr:mechanosensitive ion channel [Chloroflexota bacterium]
MAGLNMVLGTLLIQINGWPEDRLLQVLLTFVVWAAIGLLAYWLLFPVGRMLVSSTRNEFDNMVLRTGRVPLFVAIVAYGVVQALEEVPLGPDFTLLLRRLYTVVVLAVVFYLAWRVVREFLLRWLAHRAAESESNVDDLLVPIVKTLGPLVFFLVALAFILQALDVNIGVLLASIGAVSLIIGLAFQDTLGNLFSGVYLMIDPPFREDDLIILPENKIYRVEKVGLRMTQLYDMTNHALIYMPNNVLTRSSIANINKPTVDMRTITQIRTTMDADPARVRALLREIVQSHRNILHVPEKKLVVLRNRINKIAMLSGASSTVLTMAQTALEEWWREHTAKNNNLYSNLLQVRTQLTQCLIDAQTALGQLRARGEAVRDVEQLRTILGGVDASGRTMGGQQTDRIAEIDVAWQGLANTLSQVELEPLRAALNSIEELHVQAEALEQELLAHEKRAIEELDDLLTRLVEAGNVVAEALHIKGFYKESARIKLWVQNVAVVYNEMEMLDSIRGLNAELDGLIHWLRTLEAGGLTRQERLRIRGLFTQWGGMQAMCERRLNELRPRIMRYTQWKEEDVLPPSEYRRLVEQWERKLRLLSTRLLSLPAGDEELLDNYLTNIKRWINSNRFHEPFEDWKVPGASFKGFGDFFYFYNMSYYIDDIKLENFERQSKVTNDLMMDIYEVFQREGIQVPVPRSEIVALKADEPDTSSTNGAGVEMAPETPRGYIPGQRTPTEPFLRMPLPKQ